jgi:iron complex outermembrane receptor protein
MILKKLIPFLFILPVWAEPTPSPEPAQVLPETLISASRESLTSPTLETLRERIAKIPGGAEVIDAETYKKGRATTLKDALDYAPGVFIQSRFGAEESRLSIRGSGIQRTFHGRGIKLLQDGIPLNLADGGFDFQAVEPLSAKAVEVFRGANALEYGATTLGGAVNFLSRTGYDAPRFSALFEHGSYESFRSQVAAADVVGPFDYYASLSLFSLNGYREHSKQSNQRLFSNFGYQFNPDVETRFYVTYAVTDSELPGNITKAQLDADPTKAARSGVGIFDYINSDWKRDFDILRIANKTTWKDGDQRFSLSTYWSRKDLHHPILYVIDQLTNDFGAGVRYDFLGDVADHKNRFTLGFTPAWGVTKDDRYDNVLGKSGTKRAQQRDYATNLDLYAENQFWITEKAAISLGSQVSYAQRTIDNAAVGTNAAYKNEQDWWGFSPKIGFLVEPTKNTQVFANVSRSFEPPSFGELVGSNLSGFPNFTLTGTPAKELEAQTATTIEIGTRGRSKYATWDLSYYYSWLENELMEFQVYGTGSTVNADKTTHQGIELGGSYDILHDIFKKESPLKQGTSDEGAYSSRPSFDRVTLRANYLWNNFRYNGDSTYGNRALPGIPEHYLRGELVYEHPSGFYAGPNIEYVPAGYAVDSMHTLFTDSYALFGAKMGWRSERGFSAYVEVKNLADINYAATTGVIANAGGADAAQFSPGDGRAFYAGLEYRW